ncbi:MAG: cyclomaltodextrinase N-terminal domain-containing protein [Melioribacteraceae bacterium]|nr:cyclomaltodextrinase N-terminal domain-containing protein [Melioribacteraceae bacterium]MCF8263106.1 cyclomaltodextrinase N-terminal domain-containing protein [Melioribacteraceae bacterium]MCF8430562.1 cyclomaltodextrinase N-terminal domain-containing protein [Melioribacteraceae bacterium]
MKTSTIQLMVYGENLNDVEVIPNDGIEVLKVHKIENPSYAFVDIKIDNDAKPGDYTLTFRKNGHQIEYSYKLNARSDDPLRYQGFDNSDAIYLLMPDRFANGDVENDSIDGYYDSMQHIEFQKRYGGDLQGVINNLNYIKELGFTTIWLNPVFENNTFRSYHGYNGTDFYKVDPRLGTIEKYTELIEKAHKMGLKIIFDHVANHFSNDHEWFNNLPVKEWINGTPEKFPAANHNKMAFTDPHTDSSTINHVIKGWFVDYMADFNQRNPFVANYIIQNTIWWIETTGFNGIREDTYPYCDQDFMARWAKTILDEYPSFNIVGEVWTGEPAFLSGYQKNNPLTQNETHLPSVTDFALRDFFVHAVQGQEGFYKLFNIFAKDFLYSNPDMLLTFADNHDVGRILYYAKGNLDLAKMVYTILFTSRGIPSVLYASELGVVSNEDHGQLRVTMPGGFPNDKRNAFEESGRTDYEKEIFNYLRTLLHLRKDFPALATGKMTHFPPKNETYFYFKSNGDQTLLVVLNGNPEEKTISFEEQSTFVNENSELIDLFTNEKSTLNGLELTIPPITWKVYLIQ